jgi:glycosyltransferase involved in cell wall biosynthesis
LSEALRSFAIVANGFAEGPAQALRDHLVGTGARVVAVSHPLTPEDGTRHVIAEYAGGRRVGTRTVRLPLRPPLSFALDPLVPLLPPHVDAWFGFNPLACARGLAARSLGRARLVVLWSVDFAPDRFGAGTLTTRLYDRIDRLACTRADGRVELSEAARDARNRRHGLDDGAAPAHVVPMGAWLERVPTTPPDGYARRRAVFLGHLVERQGVDLFLEGVARLVGRGDDVRADIVGSGPLETTLREHARRLGVAAAVRFHGFVDDHRDVERLLAEASVGVAPYRPSESTFTRFADPGKLKAYLAAGLPIVLTDVPPNARELEQEAGAEVVPYDDGVLADAILRSLDAAEWARRRAAALGYARRFDWAVLLPAVLAKLGLSG